MLNANARTAIQQQIQCLQAAKNDLWPSSREAIDLGLKIKALRELEQTTAKPNSVN